MPQGVLIAKMVSTPSKPFYLPPYDDRFAQIFVKAHPPLLHLIQPYNSRILAFIDVEAKPSDNSDVSSSPSL